jgi:hypothetical protein
MGPMSDDLRILRERFIEGCRADQGKLRQELASLESGRMFVGSRPFAGLWKDITRQRIEQIKGEIANLESALTIVTANSQSE